MAHADYAPRDRLSLRAFIRARLRGGGLLEFADDDEEARLNIELVYMNCGQRWREDALRKRTRLELQALLATTTDVPTQSIGNTVLPNDEFWSSTGSSSGSVGEALLYRLPQPLARVAYVSVAVYRANYQHGDPLYPSRKVSFLTGPTPNQLYPASPIYPVRLTDLQQVFALSPTAAVSQYLLVRLHGCRQRQWEDLQFYIAIQHVAAYGDPMDPSYCFQIARLAGSGAVAWPCTRGLLPTAAAAAGAAGGEAYLPPFSAGPGGRQPGGRQLGGRQPGGRQLGVRASLDLVLPEDVYEAGPESLEGSRKTGVATAFARGAPRPEPELGAKTAAAAVPGCALRPPAALPSGPTESELRQAVERAGLLRDLPHLVRIAWGEVLTARKERPLRQQQPPHNLTQQQHHQHQHHQQRQQQAPRGARGEVQGGGGRGPGAGAAGGWPWRAGGGGSDAGGSGGAGAGAGNRGRAGPWHRLCQWVVTAGEAAAGRGYTSRDPGPEQLQCRACRDSPSSCTEGGGGGERNDTDSRGSDPWVSDAALPATLIRQAELSASGVPSVLSDDRCLISGLMRGVAHDVLAAAGGAGAGGSVTAAPAGADASALRHIRPEQSLPPQKLIRFGDGDLTEAAAAAAVGSGSGPWGDVDVRVPPARGAAAGHGRVAVQWQRLRQYQRAAERAMQTAVYSPAESGGHIFVALKAWAGGGGGAGAAAAARGDAAGSWLVSHYDHEHL